MSADAQITPEGFFYFETEPYKGPFFFSGHDPFKWDTASYVDLPGRCLKLATIGEDVWAACEVVPRWWQFWQTEPSISWVKLKPPVTSA